MKGYRIFALIGVFVVFSMLTAFAANQDGTVGIPQVSPPPEEKCPFDETVTCLNFDDLTAGTKLTTYGGVTFTNTHGDLNVLASYPGPVFTSPNAVLPANYSASGNRTRATFPTAVSYVSVTMGDYAADSDNLYLEAYDAGGNLIDSDFQSIPNTLSGGVDLAVSGSNIAYVEFWGVGVNNNSVLFDNLCFESQAECDYCFDDSYGFRWCLDVIDTISGAMYFKGTVDMGGQVRNAVATYLTGNKGMSMCADEGTGVAFNYNLVVKGGLKGVWINISPTAGHGTVTVQKVPCSSAREYEAAVKGPVPGVEK